MSDLEKRELYHAFCLGQKNVPLFLQSWWLDLVCQAGHWSAAMVTSNHRVAAAMPYFLQKQYGIPTINMPPLSPFLGPLLDYPEALKRSSRYDFEEQMITELLQQLPKVAYIRYKCHYALDNFLPFHWQGFRNTTRTSYVLDLNDWAQVQKGFNRNIRRNIKQAEMTLRVADHLSLATFYEVLNKSYQRQKRSLPYSFDFLQNMDKAIQQHQAGKKFFVLDPAGQVLSVAYLVWDETRSYYWLSGDDPQYRKGGSGIWICWQAMQYVAQNRPAKIFDFAGSIIPEIEKIRRQFGAEQQHFFQFEKFGSGVGGLLAKARGMLR